MAGVMELNGQIRRVLGGIIGMDWIWIGFKHYTILYYWCHFVIVQDVGLDRYTWGYESLTLCLCMYGLVGQISHLFVPFA